MMKLNELKLPIGKPLKLTVVGQDYKQHEFFGNLMGYEVGEVLMISLPVKPGQVLLRQGLQVSIEIPLPSGIARFNTSIESIVESSFRYVCLAYPARIEFEKLRDGVRVPIDTPITLQAHTNLGMSTSLIHGQMLDVSASGANIVTEKKLSKIITKVTIGALLSISGLEKNLNLTAVIRQINKPSKGHAQYNYAYGIQFIEIEEINDLFIRLFIHEVVENEGALLC